LCLVVVVVVASVACTSFVDAAVELALETEPGDADNSISRRSTLTLFLNRGGTSVNGRDVGENIRFRDRTSVAFPGAA
jgi:hypothetical protein